MKSHPEPPEENFLQAEKDWDLPKLYADLASVNHKELTQTEKKYLRGLLLGYSPDEIAAKVSNRPDADSNSVRVTLARGVYKPIKGLFNLEEISWGRVRSLLEAKYKKGGGGGGEQPPLLQLWNQLKLKATPTDKMGPKLAAISTLEMWESPSDYLKTVKLGSQIQFHLELETTGHLILLEKGTSGRLWCLCPSFFAPQSYLNSEKVVLPQENSPQTSFKVSGVPGMEEIVAIIAATSPPFPWLPKPDQNPLQLQELHLQELLGYFEGRPESSILYMDYTVAAS
jgi:Domain of unknown function (DUF4384)